MNMEDCYKYHVLRRDHYLDQVQRKEACQYEGQDHQPSNHLEQILEIQAMVVGDI